MRAVRGTTFLLQGCREKRGDAGNQLTGRREGESEREERRRKENRREIHSSASPIPRKDAQC